MKKILLLASLAILLTSCDAFNKSISSRSKRPVISSKDSTKPNSGKRDKASGALLSHPQKVDQYLSDFSDIAIEEMKTYGIPASITLAQGILESGAGYGELTLKAKNHFGIKCHTWDGDRVYHDDDRDQECFRKYKDASESFRDHSLFLKDRKRYARLFSFGKKDYRSWAKGLKEAGYATDKRYPQKLINIIQKYRLYDYDDIALGDKKREDRKQTKEIVEAFEPASTNEGLHTVEKGDTLYSISKRYDISVDTLKKYNELTDTGINIGQVLRVVPGVKKDEDF